MLPYVVLHNAVSLDGRTDWLDVDLGLFYGLVQSWNEDATLVGSETVISSLVEAPEEEDGAAVPLPGNADDPRPLLVVPDSRGRVRGWNRLRRQPYWRDIVVLGSDLTPKEYLESLAADGIDCIVAGDDHVDYRLALRELKARHGVKTIRVDSGGTLNGALLRAGLVDEVSVLFTPALGGGESSRSLYRAPDLESGEGIIPLELIQLERLNGGTAWLRYKVAK
ncbi:MAG: RibD family protein [Firmicutes bacterium]|nr:RibD family protein [Bacillota bacterium]